MKIEEIRELMNMLDKSNLSSIEIDEGSSKIKLEKFATVQAFPTQQTASLQMPTQCAQKEEVLVESNVDVKQVKAPLVGVFYTSQSPNAQPFVKEGQKVKKGEILCLIEAMKMINEIPSPVDGTIKKILVKNEALVAFDDVLFEIQE